MNNFRKPAYLRSQKGSAISRHRMKVILREGGLHTVCESAKCPNIGECFEAGAATFLILGDICTRSCAFCAVKKGAPNPVDFDEPNRVAAAASKLNLKHVVITSVTRDDLPDGGAGVFAKTVAAIRSEMQAATIEALVPDFMGNRDAIETVIKSKPEVFNHNVETIPRLYSQIRPGADWRRSLAVLKIASEKGLVAKSGMMLGMGESEDEIAAALLELKTNGCEILTLGQYLAPSRKHWPVERFVTPEEFEKWKNTGLEIGFKEVVSQPLARSSYRAKPFNSR